ncbi:MAG: glycoside hydrolase family 4 [Kiritimatiellae bacterium]|nr:glycoside hydrolase family 4 [Kiritimatiellia bacterium]
MAGPKITVIGAGSYFFGRPVIHKMATSEVMAGGTLALVDTRKDVLQTMMRLARRVFDHTRCRVKVIGSTDRREVLKGSDFVVLTFSYRNAYYRGVDTEVAAKHGIRMCSSDTIGPGGIFRALREIPHALAAARDTARLAPNAWVINFVNPTAVLGIALRRYAPFVRSFALCDGHHEPYYTLGYCKLLGLLPQDAHKIPPAMQSRLEVINAGVNHFSWLLRLAYDGRDLLPQFIAKMRKEAVKERDNPGEHSKARYNKTYALELYNVFGAWPENIGHTKEYVPYFQGYGVKPVYPEPITLFDAQQREREMSAAWAVTRLYAAGRLPVSRFLAETKDDHATDIIESMWGGLGKPFFINTFNQGAVTNLPGDAFLELRCDIDMHGPRPHPVGPMPRGILALQHVVLDTHELTAEAAVTGDRNLLKRAMLTDPICNNIPDAEACIRDLLEAEREALPSYWFKRKGPSVSRR